MVGSALLMPPRATATATTTIADKKSKIIVT